MRHLVSFIVLLAISEPLFTYANRVVVVVPQQVRRSGPPPWRSVPTRFRKSSHGSEVHYHKYHLPYHSKKPGYRSPPFPHGGDDFDQGHESVNHVRIPYGKDVSHAISFGKGYIPYEKVKDSLSYDRERYPGAQAAQEHKQNEPDYATMSSSSQYTPSGPSYETQQSGTYFSDPESALDFYNGKRSDMKKYYTSRSIEKDLSVNSPIDLSSIFNKGNQQILFQPNIPQSQGSIVLPSGIPAATIGGSKEGIVLRDTVSLDAYQQKLQEMTKSWPQYFTGAAGGFQSQQASFSTAASPASSFTGSINWPFNFAQPKQGYAVKEDTMEPPHDFRTMPIQTAPLQTISAPINVALSSLMQPIHA